MVKLQFKNKSLEQAYRSWKWARNNSIELFKAAEKENLLEFTPSYKLKGCDECNILHQFQCILTTTDTYFRKMKGPKKQPFGMLIINGQSIKKEDLKSEVLEKALINQLFDLENFYKNMEEKKFLESIRYIETILAHEYLHQGQLVQMLRLTGVKFPARYQKAWAL